MATNSEQDRGHPLWVPTLSLKKRGCFSAIFSGPRFTPFFPARRRLVFDLLELPMPEEQAQVFRHRWCERRRGR